MKMLCVCYEIYWPKICRKFLLWCIGWFSTKLGEVLYLYIKYKSYLIIFAAPNNSPQNLEATGLSPTNGDAPSVQVTFTRPETPGVITGYNVYYTEDPTLPFDDWGKIFLPETGTPQISGIIRNLYPDTTYYVTATAVNQAGEGPASYLATATTTSGGMFSYCNRLWAAEK